MPTPTGPYAGHAGAVRALAVIPGGAQMVTGGEDGTARVWQRLTGELVGTLIGHAGPVHAVAVTPDGAQIVTGGEDGTARVWQRLTGELVGTLVGHAGPVHAVAVTPDGAQIVTGGEDGTARVWQRLTGALVSTLIGHTAPVRAVVVTPDGAQIITGADGNVRVWDRTTGELVGTLVRRTSPVQTMAITPEGTQIVTGGQDGTAQVRDRATGETVTTLTGHTGAVHAVAVTPDGAQIVTGGQDGTAQVWDRATGEMVTTLTGHTGAVHALAVAPDGAQILTGGGDGDIRIWDHISGQQIAGTSLGAVPKSTLLADVTSDAESPEDRLGIRADVRTVAALAAAVSTIPPLSIALLGEWGAGKSTFMLQMCDRIQHLAMLSRKNPGRSLFAANVRQIRFNAWHYSDDTVWVGLVEHLFQTLADSDPARPRSAEEVQRERVALDAQLADNKVRRARITRPDTSSDEPRLTPSTLGVLAGIAARDVLAGLRRHVPRSLAAVGIVAAAAVAAFLWRNEVFAAVVAITAVATAGAAAWSLAPKIISAVHAIAEQVRAEIARRTAQLDQDIRSDEARLRQLDAARRLGDYLTELRKPERYADYRGLLGRVYNDLRDLADSLTAARRQWVEGGSMGPPPLQRIVLYVDDLDRCPPDKVVDVLRAAHLLLALPLFVVIVAVDPRWLRRAIDQHYAMLFRPEDDGRASPTDYLDKIFQVPFALRPIGSRAGGYIQSLLPDATVTAPPESASGGSPARLRPPAPAPPAGGEHERAASLGNPAERDGGTSAAAGVPRASPEFDDLRPSGLRITAVERAFLARLGPLLSTPRAVKRLVNLYRLLRIGVSDAMIDEFVGTVACGGPYQAAALLLAVIVGSPDEGRQLLLSLRTVRTDKEITEFLRANGQLRLAEVIESIDRDISVHRDAETFRAWGGTVARFSFATYDLFQDVDDV
jgi:KAP family P-loop domain/WD domain, G-beta repeat